MTARYDLPEHAFAPYIRILGRGKKGQADLSFDQAHDAMRMILNHQVQPEQLGAFLMLMRVKEETAEELAGFVAAARASLPPLSRPDLVDLDWPSYAGKRRHPPWFLLAALLLAQQGTRILLHGASGHTANRLYVEQVLPYFGLAPAHDLAEAERQLKQQHFSYLPLSCLQPQLAQLIDLRALLGLRSPVHSLVRMLNPGHAKATLLGIFHRNYRDLHQQAAVRLGDARVAIFRGEGGEGERNPDADCDVFRVTGSQTEIDTWPRLCPQRHTPPATLQPEALVAVWEGRLHDDYGLQAVLGSTALALATLDPTLTQQAALQQARQLWSKRSRTATY
ncbi:MAG: glycosyl transferase family protein [Methylococcales bacterium]|nr:glycosyl transferase family protein [Methylococcales bacterium]